MRRLLAFLIFSLCASPAWAGNDPFSIQDGPAHGPDWLALGGHGELRLGEDRVRGVTDPEWFSVSRVNGFIHFTPSNRWRMAVEGTWDHPTDHFMMERIEAGFRKNAALEIHGGVFPLPLGRVNLSHDSPQNQFTELSLVATQIIGVPNAMPGIGVKGTAHQGHLVYEADIVTGYSDGLITESSGGTRLPMGRANFGDGNGWPAVTGRLSLHPSAQTEWGFGAVTGPYNDTEVGTTQVDETRWVHMFVLDGQTHWGGMRWAGEATMAIIDVPPSLQGLYAQNQWGASIEASRVLLDRMFTEHTSLSCALRADAVDLDRDQDGDSRQRVSASLNIHHAPRSIVRFGWYYELARDRFANDTPKAGLTFTAATYF
jgi:hypothetical protein